MTTVESDDYNEEENTGWSLSTSGNLSATSIKTTGTTIGGGSTGCVPTIYYPPNYYYHYPTYDGRKRCDYCEGVACKTPEQCPRVKSVSYFKDGTISKIEFHNPEKN